ncbi:uncharacterized protein [Procambarus clarkii]|uniref:uncharacterized protein isoform X1 n=1 Tax=Procambarus clarkii TaxID=6728 RepID=UPI003743CB69
MPKKKGKKQPEGRIEPKKAAKGSDSPHLLEHPCESQNTPHRPQHPSESVNTPHLHHPSFSSSNSSSLSQEPSSSSSNSSHPHEVSSLSSNSSQPEDKRIPRFHTLRRRNRQSHKHTGHKKCQSKGKRKHRRRH